MKNAKYSIDMLNYIYEDGDRDLIFFCQILGMVSYNENDCLFNKNPEQRMADAIKLVDYLISTGDFNVGQTLTQQDGTFVYAFYKNGFPEFCINANKIFSQNGIDDIDLNYGIWLKKLRVGRSNLAIPNKISELFG